MGIQRLDVDSTVRLLEGALPREGHLGHRRRRRRGQERYEGEERGDELDLHGATNCRWAAGELK